MVGTSKRDPAWHQSLAASPLASGAARARGRGFWSALPVAILLLASAAEASPLTDARCGRALGKNVQKLADFVVKQQSNCLVRQMGGSYEGVDCYDLDAPEFPARKPLDKIRDTIPKTSARSCQDGPTPTEAGFATCPSPCEAISTSDYEGVGRCLACVTEDRATELVRGIFGEIPAEPTKTAIRCQSKIATGMRGVLRERVRVQQTCEYAANLSPLSDTDCSVVDATTDPVGRVARAEDKLDGFVDRCDPADLVELGGCADDAAGLKECSRELAADGGDSLFDEVYPPAELVLAAPSTGLFTENAEMQVSGFFRGASVAGHTVEINGVPVESAADGSFSAPASLDPSRVIQPLVVDLRNDLSGKLLARQIRTVHRGQSITDGATSPRALALRLTDRGLDRLEPSITTLVDLDIAALVPPGTVVLSNYEYFCFFGTTGCLTTDVVVNPVDGSPAGPPSLGSFAFRGDASGAGVGVVEAEIQLNDLSLSARATALGCDVNVQTSSATIRGTYDLWWDPNDRTQIDVTQLGGVNVSFAGFSSNTDCGDGFGDGLLESLVGLFVSDVEGLFRGGFSDFLNQTQGGDDDPPIASAVEVALAGVDITGPIGSSLSLDLQAPIFDIPIDNEGITIGNDARIVASPGGGSGQCSPPAGTPDLAASLRVDELFPVFGVGTPVGGRAYDIGLGLSTSAFNQLLKAETECGLLADDISSFGGVLLTSALLASYFDELEGVWPTARPARVQIRPGLAPVLTGEGGPQGELAKMEIGQLELEVFVEEEEGPALVLMAVLDMRVGLDLAFDNILDVLAFRLGDLPPENIGVHVLDNPFEIPEEEVRSLLVSLLPLALADVTSSLGSFPIPSFLGRAMHGIEVSRMGGGFIALSADLLPEGTILQHDYQGANYGDPNIALVGDAVWAEDSADFFQPQPLRLRLTDNSSGRLGAAWYTGHRIDAASSWSTDFRFQLSYGNGGGADGVGFHLQGDGPGAMPGENGSGLSGPALSVTVDTWNNGGEGTDESLQVWLGSQLVYFNNLRDVPGDPTPGSVATPFRMELEYFPGIGQLRVALFDESNGGRYLDERISVNLVGLGLSWAGFSARTGGAGENHDILSWRLGGRVPVDDLEEGLTTVGLDFTSVDFETPVVAPVGDAFWTTDEAPVFLPHPQRLRLTDNASNRNGAAWYEPHRIDPSRSWSTTYRFQTTFPGDFGADGIGFHVQSDGLEANPAHDGTGLTGRHLSVVIDTFNNGPEQADESLRVMLDGQTIYANNLLDAPLDPKPGARPEVFRMQVSYIAPLKQLWMQLFDEGGTDHLNDAVGVSLDGFGPSWIGFSASTGTYAENHDIRSWSHTAAAVVGSAGRAFLSDEAEDGLW